MPLVSVIVPIYNVESQLGRCLVSLRGQSLPDFEAILVDDGSADRSGEIAEDFAASDPRFRYVRQENRGLGGARNTGLWLARGRYLAFVDSDDYVDGRFLEVLTAALEADGADIAACGVTRVLGDGSSRPDRDKSLPAGSISDMTAFLPGASFSACNRLFRRELFDGLRFPEGMAYEDCACIPLVLARARRIVSVSDALYFYAWRADSITSTAGSGLDMLQAQERLEASSLAREHPAALRRYFYRNIVGSLLWGMLSGREPTDGAAAILREGLRRYPAPSCAELRDALGWRKLPFGLLLTRGRPRLARAYARAAEGLRRAAVGLRRKSS